MWPENFTILNTTALGLGILLWWIYSELALSTKHDKAYITIALKFFNILTKSKGKNQHFLPFTPI